MTKTLAILYNENDEFSPSNQLAIYGFVTAAKHAGLDIVVGDEDYLLSKKFDALFIRKTTSPKNLPYRMACRFSALPCIDDFESIRICCDKVYQTKLFLRKNIPHPNTFIFKEYDEKILSDYCFEPEPTIIKISDSCYSQGVFRAISQRRFLLTCKKIFQKHDELIVQEFIKTDFDWRIAVLDGQPLFAIKYYIAENDFRIIKYFDNGEFIEGRNECIALVDVPPRIIALAVRTAALVGDGLYGVDIKQTRRADYVIEINDNVSIDNGVEDKLLGMHIYHEIIRWFLKRL